jgi:hypothetical protein
LKVLTVPSFSRIRLKRLIPDSKLSSSLIVIRATTPPIVMYVRVILSIILKPVHAIFAFFSANYYHAPAAEYLPNLATAGQALEASLIFRFEMSILLFLTTKE